MKRIGCLLLCLALLASAGGGCRGKTKLSRYQATFLTLFDTVTVVTGYAAHREAFLEQVQIIYDELEVYHRLYNIYEDYEGVANIKTINDNAGVRPVRVDPKIIDLLSYAREMYETTGGWTNIALGSVLSLWHEARTYGIDHPEEAFLPDWEALQEAALHTDIQNMVIDQDNNTVYLSDPDMRLDVGAIAKGYAVEQVCKQLKQEGLNHYIVSAGGNICAIGPKPDGSSWKVGVDNPYAERQEEKYLATLGVVDMAVVTSGSDQRYYTVEGVRYHHIISPATLYPENRYRSVTILSASSALADALSTALFNMTLEEGMALIDRLEATEAMWVGMDGSITYSEGFENYFMDEKG